MGGKHVIILGAGASFTSGYPLANQLRLLIGSEIHFRAAAEAAYKEFYENNPLLKKGVYDYEPALHFFRRHAKAVSTFRRGGFATVDEFCKLIALQKDKELSSIADGMRHLTRLALGIRNPEYTFQDSDYYPFVQRLFQDDLSSLRDDLTILTFNYDPYLDFLLKRALRERADLIGGEPPSAELVDSVTSGFLSKNTAWLETAQPRFKLLKLHGTICSTEAEYDHFFTAAPNDRIKKLTEYSSPPPILFPWEVLNDEDKFYAEENFPHPEWMRLFHAIWQTAKKEIQSATKVSFVGLSMHPFLLRSMGYLFYGLRSRDQKVQIAVADTLHQGTDRHDIEFKHPAHTPAKKLHRFFEDLKLRAKSSNPKDLERRFLFVPTYRFSALTSFREFIEREMDPIIEQS